VIINNTKQVLLMALLMASLLILLWGCNRIPYLKDFADDNIIEEAGEYIIKAETGIIIDFTPESFEQAESENRRGIAWTQ